MARVCSVVGCPNLKPCPTHPGRPKNAHWSKDRDRTAQRRFRAEVLERDGYACVRCGSTTDLVAHHDQPGYEAQNGRTLCEDCHATVDGRARKRAAPKDGSWPG